MPSSFEPSPNDPDVQLPTRGVSARNDFVSYQGRSSLTAFGSAIKVMLPDSKVDLNELPSHTIIDVNNTAIARNGFHFDLEYRFSDTDVMHLEFDLPPYDWALACYTEFDTYLGGCFYFFNKLQFKHKMRALYVTPTVGPCSRDDFFWHAELLLVLALGELYLAGSKRDFSYTMTAPPPDPTRMSQMRYGGAPSVSSTSAEHHPGSRLSPDGNTWTPQFPGSKYFERAAPIVGLMLQQVEMNTSLVAVEVLMLYCFFHLHMDWQKGAYAMSGIAMRSVMLLGLYEDADKDRVTLHELEHRRRLWWTCYYIDSYLSAKSGFPMTIDAQSILAGGPSDIAGSDSVYGEFSPSLYLRGFIEVSKITTIVLSELYQRKHEGSASIIPTISDIMARLFEWNKQWAGPLKIDWVDRVQPMSRTSANICSEYSQCVNMTVRPLLLYFVRKRLAERTTLRQPIDLSGYSQNIITLLNASLSASVQTIHGLYNLLQNDLYATFGYLDREYTFASASTLVLFNVAFGVCANTCPYIKEALELLYHSEKHGNANAKNRREQLLNLISTFEFLDHQCPHTANYHADLLFQVHTPSGDGQAVGQSHYSSPELQNYQTSLIATHGLADMPINKHIVDEMYYAGVAMEKDIWNEVASGGTWMGNANMGTALDEFRNMIAHG